MTKDVNQARQGEGWRLITDDLPDGEYLLFWPGYYLDEDWNLTDRKTGTGFIGAGDKLQGEWSEPDALNAVGARLDDDWEYGHATHWMPKPDPPALPTPEERHD